MAGKVYIGTSGWSYKHWKGNFYPADVKAPGYLKYLSAHFNCTEINTSFYHLPKPATIKQWTEEVPATFKFCPKMSRYLTQMKKLLDPEEPLSRFFTIFRRMKKKMGPVLLQLPPQLGFHRERTEKFFQVLKRRYASYRFALECRHDSWFTEESVSLMKKFKISFVIADSGGRFPSGEFITAKDIYVRFHGPDGSYATSYSRTSLRSYAKKCMAWSAKGHHVWMFFNNDIHGYATQNAETLKKMIGKSSKYELFE